MVSDDTGALVTTAWLGDHLDAPDVRVVDASWYLPQSGRNGHEEYQSAHIPGAVFFDIDDTCDTDSDLPHMLPSAEKFSSRVRRMGLGDGNRIIVYDGSGCLSAARVWWMFMVFGHNDVAVLDGGFPKWRAEGRPVEDLPAHPRERHFTARLNTLMVRDLKQMQANVINAREQVLDARSGARFAGTEPEPRPGLPGGHIPGSTSVPYMELLDPVDQTFLPTELLRETLIGRGIDLDRPIITTCGSGVTAAIISLALHAIGCSNTALYDGSWAEWALRENQSENGADRETG